MKPRFGPDPDRRDWWEGLSEDEARMVEFMRAGDYLEVARIMIDLHIEETERRKAKTKGSTE